MEKTCPSSQKCCKVDGQNECCDLDVEIPEKEEKIYAGMGMKAMEKTFGPSYQNTSAGVIRNGFLDECSLDNCKGTCCSKYGCCSYQNAECCPSGKCCPHLNTCCDGGCCSDLGTCCGSGCCRHGYQCCYDGGCCPFSTTCCSGICCLQGRHCCNGWCCNNSQRCGRSPHTCINAAVVFTPTFTSFLMLVAGTFVPKSNFL
ncbi:uncharacterized protein TNCT_84941 [Trichonephila clavata]|uniref:Uncharacterized protein n=1 Tax=Trichonephila clavata TaxID=2740835 RepID=A0A8X6GJZ8_TRICU|nr:uncharacterized protein TNCT_84941 [Trichonephila clavata]